jgi:Egh16-like virulence factor
MLTSPLTKATAGVLTMVFHQINADGAGPIACSISSDATGKTFTAITVSKNVPGTNGKSNAANQDFPLVAEIKAGTTCTGTIGALKNLCAVKCANQVGPFGGTVIVQQAVAKKRNIFGGSLTTRAKLLIPKI